MEKGKLDRFGKKIKEWKSKQTRPFPRYATQLKREALELVKEFGPKAVSDKSGINYGTLHLWRKSINSKKDKSSHEIKQDEFKFVELPSPGNRNSTGFEIVFLGVTIKAPSDISPNFIAKICAAMKNEGL